MSNKLSIKLGMIHIWRPWKMSNFQDLPPPLVHLRPKFFNHFTLDVQFQTIPPPLQMIRCMWKNEIKTKTKSSDVTFKLTMRSILLFSPTNNAMVSLKDDFTVWCQMEDFLSIILMFGSARCLVLAQTQFSLMKKKKIGRPEQLLSPQPLTSDNISFLP